MEVCETMDIPRLNGAIKALAAGQTAFVTFAAATAENAQAIGAAPYDAVVFEMEHGAYDIRALRDSFQYLLDRRQIAESGSLAPAVAPLVRIPPNGGEMNQWIAKQVLDSGAYGIVWPHVSTVQEALNAVTACRYPRPADAPIYHPPGQRGDAPTAAARYWGISQQEYYRRADVWPLAPEGEILVGIMCEEVRAVENLPEILENVPGIGLVVIGEGDLSQDLGHPRQYDHPLVVAAMDKVLETCKKYGVACGHPHVDSRNIERVLEQGFRWVMTSPERSFNALNTGRRIAQRT
jgi:4-hydroxy-2-oxoheptanedioate aldolase